MFKREGERNSLESTQGANKTPFIKDYPASKLGNMIYGIQYGILDLIHKFTQLVQHSQDVLKLHF